MLAGRGFADLWWVADCALCVRFGEPSAETLARVHAGTRALRRASIAGCVDITPAYATILVSFDLAQLDVTSVEKQVLVALGDAGQEHSAAPREVSIPTCYDGGCGLDLDAVASACGLTRAHTIELHHRARYTVAFLGFSPGFPYLAGLPSELAAARLPQPRLRVPWGSVAIAGHQAGIYPHATAGGWRILGRTPLLLFDAHRQPATLLQAGDRVRFTPIPHSEHQATAAMNLAP